VNDIDRVILWECSECTWETLGWRRDPPPGDGNCEICGAPLVPDADPTRIANHIWEKKREY
jgi:hypothetical protein